MTTAIVIVSVVVMPVVFGMIFGRNAPHRPEYDRIA